MLQFLGRVGDDLVQQELGSRYLRARHFDFPKCMILQAVDELTGPDLLPDHFAVPTVQAYGQLRADSLPSRREVNIHGWRLPVQPDGLTRVRDDHE